MSEIISEVKQADCMEYMAQFPDKYFDLAIVDPPYGIGASANKRANTKRGKALATSKDYGFKSWDFAKPSDDYFNELRRVSVNQIVWGGNYYGLQGTSCFIVWDKKNGNNGYADCELAWTSFNSAVRMFAYQWHGMLQENMKQKENRIHPTQKPVALYKWLLTNYAKQGDKILDTHLGSQSSRIAAYDLGFDFYGCELDADYFAAGNERFERHKAQPKLFTADVQKVEQVGFREWSKGSKVLEVGGNP